MIIPKQAKFPADPVLERLLAEARRSPNLDIVVEVNLRLRRTYSQLLGDVVKTRDGLVKHRKKLTFQSATRNETNYVAIITGNGYEHIVAFLAIRAMGSTPMPLASSLNADEVGYFLTKARSTHVLVGKDSLKITASILDDLQSRDSTTRVMVIPISTGGMPIDPNNVKIDHSRFMKPDGPGLVLFTSGTTGPPKGAILPRRLFAQVEAAQLGEATFNCRPGHWFGGNRSLLEPVLSGQRVYILPELQGRDRTEAVLGIFRNYRITYAMFTPTLLRDMRDALLMGRQELSKAERDYWHGRFGDLSRIRCATGVVEQSVRQFWTRLSGCPFENNYGSTELGGGALVGLPTMQGSMGKPVEGVEVKLSDGKTGEIMVKSPRMLIGYLNDAKQTREAFDQDGYFKTGDLSKMINNEFIFHGRANSDFVQHDVFQISAVDVESNLLDLPYITEACVVGVPDNDTRHHCAAIVRVQRPDDYKLQAINLALIRSDLEAKLAHFMLPTLLRILGDDESLPVTISGKVVRREALRQFFGVTEGISETRLPCNVERWVYSAKSQAG